MTNPTTIPSDPFFLVVSNRSGSHLLKDLIESSNQIGLRGFPVDLAEAQDEDVLSYFENSRPVRSEHWGVMVRGKEYLYVLRYLKLVQIDPSQVKWVWLRRKNKIRQAVSSIRVGMMTENFSDFDGRFDSLKDDDPPEKHKINQSEFDIPLDLLYRNAIRYLILDSAWEEFFRYYQITPHTVFYEDFMNRSGWNSTIRGIFDFIGKSYTLPLKLSTKRLKQAIDELPDSYHSLMADIRNIHAPMKYTNYVED